MNHRSRATTPCANPSSDAQTSWPTTSLSCGVLLLYRVPPTHRHTLPWSSRCHIFSEMDTRSTWVYLHILCIIICLLFVLLGNTVEKTSITRPHTRTYSHVHSEHLRSHTECMQCALNITLCNSLRDHTRARACLCDSEHPQHAHAFVIQSIHNMLSSV